MGRPILVKDVLLAVVHIDRHLTAISKKRLNFTIPWNALKKLKHLTVSGNGRKSQFSPRKGDALYLIGLVYYDQLEKPTFLHFCKIIWMGKSSMPCTFTSVKFPSDYSREMAKNHWTIFQKPIYGDIQTTCLRVSQYQLKTARSIYLVLNRQL